MSNYSNFNKYPTLEPNTNYEGKAFFTGHVTNPEICRNLCSDNSKCFAWSYNTTNKECQLKDQPTNKNKSIYMIGGQKIPLAMISNSTAVTMDRFGNNTKNINAYQNRNPYYATGVPINNESDVSIVNTDNSVPFDGRSIYPSSNQLPNQIPNLNQTHQPNAQRISSNLNNVIFPWTSGNSSHINTKNADDCRDACLNNNKCSKWSYTTEGIGLPCVIEEGKPQLIYNFKKAQSGQIYNQQPYRKAPINAPISH
jgi:hypothetical protein